MNVLDMCENICIIIFVFLHMDQNMYVTSKGPREDIFRN